MAQALADNAWTGRMAENVIVEHTSANPDGPLHVGHIRNSVIGDTLVRILRRAGCSVDAQYYINDMGRQEAMVVVGLDHFQLDGSKADHAIAKVYIAANRLMETNPEIRDEADSVIQRYEAGEEETVAKIQSAIKYAIGGIEATLHRMNIRHDSYHWESEFVRKGDVAEIVSLLEKTGLTQYEGGAFQLDLSQFGFEKKMVLKRANGTSLYITRDLAYHRWKSQNSDRSVDILGADHKLVSGQLRTALRLLGVREPEVVIFEFVSLPTGSMSTRKGKFISADELLDEVESRAYQEVRLRRPEESDAFLKEVAVQVAAGAVRYDVVKVSADKATTFDWKQALDFEKLSAPFIQYSHARACSILRKGEAEEGQAAECGAGFACGPGRSPLRRERDQSDQEDRPVRSGHRPGRPGAQAPSPGHLCPGAGGELQPLLPLQPGAGCRAESAPRQNGSGKSCQKCSSHHPGHPGHCRIRDDVNASAKIFFGCTLSISAHAACVVHAGRKPELDRAALGGRRAAAPGEEGVKSFRSRSLQPARPRAAVRPPG